MVFATTTLTLQPLSNHPHPPPNSTYRLNNLITFKVPLTSAEQGLQVWSFSAPIGLILKLMVDESMLTILVLF